MVHIHTLDHASVRQNFINDFALDKSTWLFADLESKRLLQNKLLSKHPLLPENACLRVNEFWQKQLFAIRPELQVITPALMQSFLTEWLNSKELKWARGMSGTKTLIAYIEFFLPIFVHPDGDVLIKDWLEEQKSSAMKWGHWYQLSKEAHAFVSENHWILSKWTPAFLQGYADQCYWDNEIIVDLGPDLTALEVQLLVELANKVDVHFLCPNEDWLQAYSHILWPYHIVKGESFLQSSAPEVKSLTQPNIKLKSFATRLSEVKDCVAQVRIWLDGGAAAKDISIFAPEVETYWPVLNDYLFNEGVPVAKAQVSVLQSLPSIGQWLSHLRFELGDLTSENLEASLFHQKQLLDMNYQKFRVLFSNLMDESELSRFEEVANYFDRRISQKDSLNRNEFLSFILSHLKVRVPQEALQSLISQILLETKESLKLQVSSWMDYLSGLVARIEFGTSEMSEDGVRFFKFDSGYFHEAKHIVLMGLTEAALTESSAIQISLSEVFQLGEDLGFYLKRPEASKSKFFVDWIAKQDLSECILTRAQTHFSGQAEAPSFFWLGHAVHQEMDWETLSEVRTTRWDELQKQGMALSSQYRGRTIESAKDLNQAVLQDLGHLELPAFGVGVKPTLSASQLQNFSSCPFRFAAVRLFGLRDLPEVDLDIDRMRRGRLIHSVFESLLNSGQPQSLDEDQLSQLIENCKVSEEIYLEGPFWDRLKQEVFQISKQFISFEMSWRKDFPQTQTLGRELTIKGDWDGFPISGSIDRVDVDESEHCVVMDYKSAKSPSYSNHASWIKKSEFQLLFYIKAIESGWTELKASVVDAAFYFFIKNWERDYGLRKSKASGSLFQTETKHRSLISDTGYEALIKDFETVIGDYKEQMLSGQYLPKPQDRKTCPDCEWRTLCRAPHLN